METWVTISKARTKTLYAVLIRLLRTRLSIVNRISEDRVFDSRDTVEKNTVANPHKFRWVAGSHTRADTASWVAASNVCGD